MKRSADDQEGRAAEAMKATEAALGHQLSATASFDRQIIEALCHAQQTTVEGRRRLDNLEAEIAAAAQAWDLSTAAGAREFQRFLIAKLGEIVRVVEEASDDDTAKQALAAALTSLYAAQSGRGDPEHAGPEPVAGPDPPAAMPGMSADAFGDPFLDPLPADEWDSGYPAAPPRPPEPAAMPALPGFGGEPPGLGGMPPAIPAALPLAGLGSRAHDAPGDDGAPADDAAPVREASLAGPDDSEPAGDSPAQSGPDDGPTTVRLPDGATINVADPRLAAVIQAAADGTPVADAFRGQGIDIPPLGTPVAAPVEAARVRPGDVGMFTDRHALAVGDGKALLDGQIHLTENLRGPGFLGWQHPPARTGESSSTGEPVPTRTAGVLRV